MVAKQEEKAAERKRKADEEKARADAKRLAQRSRLGAVGVALDEPREVARGVELRVVRVRAAHSTPVTMLVHDGPSRAVVSALMERSIDIAHEFTE